MAILLAQDWDIVPGLEGLYETFITEQYLPKCKEMGLKSVGGFYVEVGFGPKLVSLKSTETLGELAAIMSTSEFKRLNRQLKEYVVNYGNRVLCPTGRVKREGYSIQKGVWKYNQYYDLIPGRKKEYADFVINEHLPTMQQFDYVEVTGGWDVILGGFCEIIAEFTFKTPVDIGRLLEDEDFRRITNKLRNEFAVNHRTRIMRTTERFDEPRWYRL